MIKNLLTVEIQILIVDGFLNRFLQYLRMQVVIGEIQYVGEYICTFEH